MCSEGFAGRFEHIPEGSTVEYEVSLEEVMQDNNPGRGAGAEDPEATSWGNVASVLALIGVSWKTYAFFFAGGQGRGSKKKKRK